MQAQTPFTPHSVLHNENAENAKSFHCLFCAEKFTYPDLLDLTIDRTNLEKFNGMIQFLKIDYIDLYHTKMPKLTCETCYNIFHTAYNFFVKVKKSQAELNRLYNVEVNTEFVDQKVIIKLEPLIECEEDGSSDRLEPKSFETFTKITPLKRKSGSPNKPIVNDAEDPLHSYNVIKHVSENRTISDNDSGVNTRRITKCPRQSPCKPHKKTKILEKISRKQSKQNDNSTSIKKQIESTNKTKTYIDNTLESSYDTTEDYITESSDSDSNVTSLKSDYSPKYCGFSVFDNDVQIEIEGADSWLGYPWSCRHCNLEFDSMGELRNHSKESHGFCYGFDCVDCEDQFNTFNSFIEHVRQHRDGLRYYCQYCNTKFESRIQCADHALSHWVGSQRICDLCGEICPDADALTRHKKLYKQVTLPRKFYKKRPRRMAPGFTYNGIPVFEQTEVKSWEDYEWTCQLCCVRVSSVECLREHSREVHGKCFSMKCADCLKVLTNYRMFAAHVAGHRPYLKKYCQYCNKHVESASEMQQHLQQHLSGANQPCDGCGQVFPSPELLLLHLRRYDPPRRKGTLTAEELTCDVCGKLFKVQAKLRYHKETHDKNRQRDHICDVCGKAFFSRYMLSDHVKTHITEKTEVCKICNKEFATRHKLKCHVLTHLDVKMFTCNECGKSFRSKARIRSHLLSHSSVKNYKCLVCQKKFKFHTNLKTHMNLHTGLGYACECCDRTFSNWSNCNKHMIRKHGVTLAKTKLTARGRVDINRETGKAKKLASDRNAKEWLDQVIKPAVRRKRKGV